MDLGVLSDSKSQAIVMSSPDQPSAPHSRQTLSSWRPTTCEYRSLLAERQAGGLKGTIEDKWWYREFAILFWGIRIM